MSVKFFFLKLERPYRWPSIELGEGPLAPYLGAPQPNRLGKPIFDFAGTGHQPRQAAPGGPVAMRDQIIDRKAEEAR